MIRFPPPSTSRTFAIGSTFLATILWIAGFNAQADHKDEPPAVGDRTPALELKGYNSETVKLDEAIRKGPFVVVVLRGNPGYQCPLCTRQAGEFPAAAGKPEAANATLIMVYPELEARLERVDSYGWVWNN